MGDVAGDPDFPARRGRLVLRQIVAVGLGHGDRAGSRSMYSPVMVAIAHQAADARCPSGRARSAARDERDQVGFRPFLDLTKPAVVAGAQTTLTLLLRGSPARRPHLGLHRRSRRPDGLGPDLVLVHLGWHDLGAATRRQTCSAESFLPVDRRKCRVGGDGASSRGLPLIFLMRRRYRH